VRIGLSTNHSVTISYPKNGGRRKQRGERRRHMGTTYVTCPPGPQPQSDETEEEFYKRIQREWRDKGLTIPRKVREWALNETEYGRRCPRSIFDEEMVGHEREEDNG
jgi:hypothetical protein